MFEQLVEQAALCFCAIATYVVWRFFWLLWPAPGTLVKNQGDDRRRIRYEFPCPLATNVRYTHEYIMNPRGMLLCTHKWWRVDQKPKGVLLICTGFSDNCLSCNVWERVNRLAERGWTVHGCDYEGHGRSDGLHVHIEDFDGMVADVRRHFESVRASYGPDVPFFVLGESMGGAVAIKLGLQDQVDGKLGLRGAVLTCPMVRISDNLRPPELVVKLLKAITPYVPTLPATPTNDVMAKAFRRPEKLALARATPYGYRLKPRLGTSLQLLEATESVNRQTENFRLPFIILQGLADTVTDPVLAQEFYRRAGSKDKVMRLYEDGWHSLLFGELEETIERAYNDIFTWLEQRL